MFNNFFRRLEQFLIEILFPLNCLLCGIEGTILCRSCFEKISLVKGEPQKAKDLDGLFVSVTNYYQIDQLVWFLKYQFVTELAGPLSYLLVARVKGCKIFKNAILVPVPLHSRRKRERGFNQSELLARAVSVFSGWPLLEFLERKRYTKPQVTLGKKERLKNVKDAFLIRDSGKAKNSLLSLAAAKVILVDDVYTTGATMQECAKILRSAGASKVYGLVLARG